MRRLRRPQCNCEDLKKRTAKPSLCELWLTRGDALPPISRHCRCVLDINPAKTQIKGAQIFFPKDEVSDRIPVEASLREAYRSQSGRHRLYRSQSGRYKGKQSYGCRAFNLRPRPWAQVNSVEQHAICPKQHKCVLYTEKRL
jgi:hypothetical protein